MILDGEAVRFLLNAAYKRERGGICLYADLVSLRRYERTRTVPVVLHHAEHRQAESQRFERRAGRRSVLRAAVDKQNVRPCGELSVLIQIMREPPRDDLAHGAVVVRRFGAADAEFPVIALEGLAVHMHRHGSDDARAAGVGDIIGLDPVRKFRELKRLLKPGERFAPALLGGRGAQYLLARVHCRLFRKAGAVAALRHLEIHAPPGHIRKPALNVLFILRLKRQKDRFRPA